MDNSLLAVRGINHKYIVVEELLKKHPYSINQGRDGRWITYLPDQDKGRKMIRKKTREELEKIVVDFWKIATENPTVSDVFYEWIETKISYNDICTGTCDRYKRDFNRFFDDDTKFSRKRVKEISSSDIKPFLCSDDIFDDTLMTKT